MKRNFIKKKGGNGIVIIYPQENIAIKTLQEDSNEEKIARYFNEIHALDKIKQLNLNNIVKIIKTNKKNKTITMKAYKGDLSTILSKTKGNVKDTIKMLLPIIKNLKTLSELETPIYHRDIKPANILYEKINGKYNLVLGDFGCCYLNDEKNRITPANRFVGAQQYRAPEYEYGRVEKVTEKGDIFSIGKILWAMINGKKNCVFPYTLWFPKEYNLAEIIPNNIDVQKINIIIAKCVSINPEDRPNYSELINLCENILENKNLYNEDNNLAKFILAEQKRELKNIELNAYKESILNIIYNSLNNAFMALYEKYNSTKIIKYLYEKFNTLYIERNSAIQLLLNSVHSPIWAENNKDISIQIHYVAPNKKIVHQCPFEQRFPWVYMYYVIDGCDSDFLYIGYQNKNLVYKYKEELNNYNEDIIATLLNEAIKKYIENTLI